MQALLDSACHPFQLIVNTPTLNTDDGNSVARDNAVLTTTYIKGMTLERFFARCDADLEGRCCAPILAGHDEFAGWAEDVGLLPGNKGSKERLAQLHIAFDTGRPSKYCQDERRCFGTTIYAMHLHQKKGPRARHMVLHHVSGVNTRDALTIMSVMIVQNTAIILRGRCMFFSAPVTNPYNMPPAHVELPLEAKDERGHPTQDVAGFERDVLPPATPSLLDVMQRCWQFMLNRSNGIVGFTEDARRKCRTIDSTNWRLAGYLQFLDDRLAAELRQTQHILGRFAVGMVALDAGFDRLPPVANVENTSVQREHVDRATLLLALVLASNAIGTRAIDAERMPSFTAQTDGHGPSDLLCAVIAPAFLPLLHAPIGQPQTAQAAAVAHAATEFEAGVLGLMLFSLK